MDKDTAEKMLTEHEEAAFNYKSRNGLGGSVERLDLARATLIGALTQPPVVTDPKPQGEAKRDKIKAALGVIKGLRGGFCPCGYCGTIGFNGGCFKCGTNWGISPIPRATKKLINREGPHIPKGFEPIEAFTNGKTIVILGNPPDESECQPEESWHDCDQMGCGTSSHVIAKTQHPRMTHSQAMEAARVPPKTQGEARVVAEKMASNMIESYKALCLASARDMDIKARLFKDARDRVIESIMEAARVPPEVKVRE